MILDLFNAKAPFADLLIFEVLSLYAELEVELAASFQGLIAIVSISLDVFKKFVGCIFVGVQDIFNDFKPENFPFQDILVLDEFLLLRWNFTREHSLT